MPASEIPGMERICDIFESFVGALAIHSGFSKVLEPLCLLFAPWAEKLCEADSSSSSPEVGRRVRDKYQFALRRLAGVSPAPLKPLNLQPLESNSSAWCIPRLADPSELLTAHMRGWRTLDSSGVELPPNYPPPVPAVESSHLRLWTEALTDVHCRLYFGTEVGSNHRYRAVGESLYALAVTTLAIDHAPAHSPAQLNELRIECTNKDLVARLGLILNLHANLRVLRIVDEADWVAPNRVATAFYAVVAVVYLQTDWSTLMAWLGELLSPWVDAAAQRRLRASSGAEKQLDPTGVRACYLTTVPKSRRNHKTRSRVAGRMGMHAA
ncbi:hypothetical protein FB45DRAFT_913930 [Roridomyces roridus]|uniref:RNase III domain-containing protein n=1 Tax=Roridomyces roridus TaxID=1738132 RepID=A0AAD7BXH1_9AGAR|nr:hypothetical protein FB45DRAFT_913930 [Roridomyces roridus]